MGNVKWDLVSSGPIYLGARAAIAAARRLATEMSTGLYLQRIEDDRGITKGWYRLTDIKPFDEISSPFLPEGGPE